MCSSCQGLQALRFRFCSVLEAGPLPAAMSTLLHLSVLQLHSLGVSGANCLPPTLPAIRLLVVCDKPDWPPNGSKLAYPASLAYMCTLTSLQTSCLNWDAGLPANLRSLSLGPDLRRWTASTTLRNIAGFVHVSRLTAPQRLHISSCSQSVADRMPELLLSLNRLIHLRHVALTSCCLTALPPMSFLRHLRSLDLSRNKFVAVPESLEIAKACRLLDISWNPFGGPAGSLPIKDIGRFVHLAALRCLGLRTVLPRLHESQGQQLAVKQDILVALRVVLASHCRNGETARMITDCSAAFPEMEAAMAERSPFQLDNCWSG